MASGSFTQGSTIELSCDGPLREPYTCYLQGGLNFAASRAGVLLAAGQNADLKDGNLSVTFGASSPLEGRLKRWTPTRKFLRHLRRHRGHDGGCPRFELLQRAGQPPHPGRDSARGTDARWT